MKLRMQRNSIRLRLLRSEVTKFIAEGFIEETVHFSPGEEALFTYALEWSSSATCVEVRYQQSKATIILPISEAVPWTQTEQIGIYAVVTIGGHGELAVTVEKDFACLDLSDAENQDTFPNPMLGAVC